KPGDAIEKVITGLEDAHEAWDVEVERVSEKILVTAKREEFYPNGAGESIVTLDHPAERGWEVLGIGRRDCRWEAQYESGVEAIDVFTTLTHLYESRRTIKHAQPASRVTKTYYVTEGILLDRLADIGIGPTTNGTVE